VPTTFKVAYYAWSEDAAHDAAHIHAYLFDYRNRDTNFFTMSSEQAIDAIESQLKVKRMYVADETAPATNRDATAEEPFAETKPKISVPDTDTSASTYIADEADEADEKRRVIEQAKALEIEQEIEAQQRLEQRKIEEAVAFELHQERNRQRALKLHEDHQRRLREETEASEKRAREQEEERQRVIDQEKRKRQAEEEALEERARLDEFERRQRAQTNRLRLEKKIIRRRQIASTIRIIAFIFLIAALIGWFWGTHNSAGSRGVFGISPDTQQNPLQHLVATPGQSTGTMTRS